MRRKETPDLAGSLRRIARGNGQGPSAWVAALDGVLMSVERTAWELRALADEAVGAWREALGGASELRGEIERLGAQARDWKNRAARLSATSWMLTKVVADYRLFAITSAFLGKAKRASVLDRLHRRNARRYYETSVSQKGAFLKLGQMLSARPDILPASWISELSKLQDDAPAEPFEHVRSVAEEDFGGALATRFAQFDERPLAAASIGQVHRAVTVDGIEIALKVQRPGIAEQVELDLSILEIALESSKSLFPPIDTETITAEVRRMVRRELDYVAEAAAMARMARFFEGTPGVHVPHPIEDLSGPRVLASPYVAGEKITVVLDRMAAAGDAEGISRILGTLLEVYLRQVLAAGFFQADPHPGNFLVTPGGDLVLLDFGCSSELPDRFREGYGELLQGFLAGDTRRMARVFPRLGFKTRSGKTKTLEIMAGVFLDLFRKAAGGEAFAWPTKEEMLEQAAQAVDAADRDPVVRIPAEFVMLGRVFGTLGGLFQHYKPRIDFASRVLPHLGAALRQAA